LSAAQVLKLRQYLLWWQMAQLPTPYCFRTLSRVLLLLMMMMMMILLVQVLGHRAPRVPGAPYRRDESSAGPLWPGGADC
jgi:hypothetical protein